MSFINVDNFGGPVDDAVGVDEEVVGSISGRLN